MWISSLTPDAIRKGFEALRPASDYDALADAARGRSRADWLVGMNLSRAYSLAYNEELSVGRVQTPTLAMVVDRELAIRSFVPEDYLEVVATFHPPAARMKREHGISRHAGSHCKQHGEQQPTRNRCRRPCGCRRTAKKRSASSSRRARAKHPSSRSNLETQRMAPAAAL